MALRSAVHKMPVLLLLLLFTSLLIHITRHLQWYVWKARTWRWENTEQNRMAKNDGEKGRIRKRAMITNYGVFLLCTCLIDWEKELVDERENKNRCNLSHHITIEGHAFCQQIYSPTDENQVGNSSHSNRKGLDIETSRCIRHNTAKLMSYTPYD